MEVAPHLHQQGPHPRDDVEVPIPDKSAGDDEGIRFDSGHVGQVVGVEAQGHGDGRRDLLKGSAASIEDARIGGQQAPLPHTLGGRQLSQWRSRGVCGGECLLVG